MNNKRESGQVLVFIVLGLVGIIAIVALAVDGGQLFAERRTAQNAADNAALAAAYALCIDEDPATAALASAASNGYNNDGTTNTVTLDNPPTSGDYSGDDEFSVATVHSHRDTIFAQVIGFNDLEVTSSATSRCRKSFEYAVVALTQCNPPAEGCSRNDISGLEVDGNGNLLVIDGGIMSNSSHPTWGLHDTGSGSITAEQIHTNGGITCTGVCSPAPEGGFPVIPDPLADVPPPDPLTLDRPPVQSTPEASTPCTTTNGYAGLNATFSGNDTITLNPGVYCGIFGDSGVEFILNPGIYYIDGPGAFHAQGGGNGSVTGSEVMIYLSPDAGPVDLNGTFDVNISAPTSGPYTGMLFYADRDYHNNISMYGNLNWTAVGTIYAAGAHLDLYGNATVNNLSSMIVANTIHLGGSSNMTVNYDPDLNFAPPTTVSLVE